MQFTVKRGAHKGRVLTPWTDKDGNYVASRVNTEAHYARTKSFDTLKLLSGLGLRVRMSAPGISPELVHPD